MRMPPDLAKSLYELPKDSTHADEYIKFSNLDILNRFGGKNPFEQAAYTLLRPKAAMRYQLLPALANKLAGVRPNDANEPAMTPELVLMRDLALLLELSDPSWTELPTAWVYLGSFLENHDIDGATEQIKSILAGIHVDKPMRFLEKFCQPMPSKIEWRRSFMLNNGDLDALEAERDESIAMINRDEEEQEAGDDL